MIFLYNKKHTLLNARILFVLLLFVNKIYGQEATNYTQNDLLVEQPEKFAQTIKKSKENATVYENIVLKREKHLNTSEVYQELGRSFSKEENYDKAHFYYDIALDLAQSDDDKKRICTITILKARAYMLNGENENAITFYATAIDQAKKHEYVRLEVIATSSYMSLLSQMDDQVEKALAISNDLLLVLDQFPDKNTKNHIQTLTTIIDVLLGDAQYDKVLSLADKGITIADSLGYKKGLSDLYVKKGIAHYYQKNVEQSQLFLNKAKHVIAENIIENDFHQKVRANYFLAKLAYDDGLYNESIDYLKLILDHTEEGDVNKLPIVQTYYLLMNCHRKLGNDKKALDYSSLYIDSNMAYQKSENKTRNRVFKRENEISLEEERKLTSIEKTRKRYAQFGFIITLIVLIILGYNFLRKQKKNKKLFNNLVSQIDQLESQSKLQEKEVLEKKNTTVVTIDDQKVQTVLKGLSKLEEQEFFLRQDCNLRTMAKKTKTNATYLSKIINTYKHKNFNEYINDLRIDYALRRLKKDRRFRSFAVKSIALEIGYKSDKSFVKHFKSKTGINPSYYIKNLITLEKEVTTIT